jgi:hypothetical protein
MQRAIDWKNVPGFRDPGISHISIARRLGVSLQRVFSARQRYGVSVTPSAWNRRRRGVVRDDGLVFSSQEEAARSLGVTPGAIWQALVNPSRTCGGFRWFYDDA